MRRTLICILSILLVFAVCSAYADTGVSTDHVQKLFNKNINGSEDPSMFKTSGTAYLGSSRIGPLNMGTTLYDYQHNGSMGRQVGYDAVNNRVHFDWMRLPSSGARKIAYNVYSSGTFSFGTGTAGGKLVSGDNGGYVNLWMAPNNGAALSGHWGPTAATYTAKAAIDANVPLGFYSFGTGAPGPNVSPFGGNCEGWFTGNYETHATDATLRSGYEWPILDVDVCGTDTIVHLVCTESPPDAAAAGEIQTIVYYRGVSVGGVVTWPSCGSAIDSVYDITVLVRSDPTSNKVARSWLKPIYYDGDLNDPCGFTQYQNDVMVEYSTDCGATWGGMQNVTDYLGNNGGDIQGVAMAYTDHSMLFDTSGKLHIVWSTPLKGEDDPCQPLYATKLWHWDDGAGGCISLVYDASKPGFSCDTGAWNTMVAKMNISECDGNMYCSFTRFGAYTSVNGDTNADCSNSTTASFMANGEIYLTASTNGGKSWGAPVNLTNTNSNECAAGDCFSEHWSSMAPYSTGEVHVQYIEDKDAGGYPQTEGTLTENPVMYVSYPCFTPDPFCNVSYSPTSIGYPTFIAPSGGVDCTGPSTRTINLEVTNAGNQDTPYSVTFGDSWLSAVGGDPTSGTLLAGCGATKNITVQLGPIGTEGIYHSTITINACSESYEIPVDLYVFCDFFLPENATISTACWSIGLWNVPRAGLAQASDLGNMYWFLEEISVMYDEGVVIGYDNDTTKTYFSCFDGSDDNVDMVALSTLTTTTEATYEYASGDWATPDTNICGTIEYYLPLLPSLCVLIEKVTISNCDNVSHTINIGEAMDWDIPDGSDGSINTGGYDASRKMLYQFGPGLGGPEDSYYGGASFCSAPVGGQITENDVWVYPNSGYDPAQIGGLMKRLTTFTVTDSVEDLNTFYVVKTGVALAPGQSVTFCKVKTSSLTGLGDLQTLIDDAKQWAIDNNLGCDGDCSSGPDCLAPGDANGSGGVDIDDVVYLIAYIFQGGPAPQNEICCGDANGSGGVDIDDVVYLIAYIFQGGPPPTYNGC